MSTTRSDSEAAAAPRSGRPPIEALRGQTFGAVVALVIQYGLGMWVNVYGHLPKSDHNKGLFDAFGRAVVNGPAGLSIHAVLGVVLLVMAIGVVVRSARLRRRLATVLGVIALISIVGAAVNGAGFVGSGANGDSFGMAISAGVALLSYVIALFSLSSASA